MSDNDISTLGVDWSSHVEQLIDQLLSSDYQGHWPSLALRDRPEIGLVTLLGEIGDRRAIPALLLVLENGHCAVRYRAADALRQIGDAAAIPHLQTQIVERYDEPTVFAAARALAALAGPDDVPFLAIILKGLVGDPGLSQDGISHAYLARQACDAVVMKLGELGDARVVPALLSGVTSTRVPDALAAIGPVAHAEMARALIPATKCDALAAIEGFVCMGEPALGTLRLGLEQDAPLWAARCALALCRMGYGTPDVVARLGPAVTDRVTAELAVRTIAALAVSSPCPELRALVPDLRLVRFSWRAGRELRSAAADAIQRVKEVTDGGHDLPRPSAKAEELPPDLPTPASRSEPESTNFPRTLDRDSDPPTD